MKVISGQNIVRVRTVSNGLKVQTADKNVYDIELDTIKKVLHEYVYEVAGDSLINPEMWFTDEKEVQNDNITDKEPTDKV